MRQTTPQLPTIASRAFRVLAGLISGSVALTQLACPSPAVEPAPATAPRQAARRHSPGPAPTRNVAKPQPVQVDRAAFAGKLATIKPGMNRSAVERLLGPPDDVRTLRDPGGISATRTVEIWRYGTAGHLSFPTLGRVHLMADGTVQYVFGGKGTPPPRSRMTEAALRRLLRLLDRVPSYSAAHRYNPRHLITAVNALHPLGKDKALAVIAEYLRVSSWLDDPGRQGVFLVLRALFDVPAPPGYQRGMMVGAPSPPPPADLRSLPRFPLVIVDEVPLLLVTGYMLAGQPEPPEWHLAYFRKTGKLRARRLRPTDNLFGLADRLAGTATTPFLKRSRASRAHILNQLLLLAETVLETRPNRFGARVSPGRDLDARWRRIRGGATRATRWSKKLQRYTFADGTSLTMSPSPLYRRELWRLPVAGASEAVLTLQRTDARYVSAELRITIPNNAPIPVVDLVLRRDRDNTVVGRLQVGKPGGSMSSRASWRAGSTSGVVMNKQLSLATGTTIRAELGGSSSPPLTP